MNPIHYLQDTFHHGWRLGLARLRLQFKKNVWNKRLRPLCLIIGHSPYVVSSWTYSATRCRRCQETLTLTRYKAHEPTSRTYEPR